MTDKVTSYAMKISRDENPVQRGPQEVFVRSDKRRIVNIRQFHVICPERRDFSP